MRRSLFILLIISLPLALFANRDNGGDPVKRKTYFTKKVNPETPVIDGKIDNDASWEHVMHSEEFIQIDPVEGAAPTEKTSFKIMYDDKNLYVAIFANDSEPNNIMSRVSRRDDVESSDMVGIYLDSYFDHRTAFEFSVNSGGVKLDALHSNDGDDSDESWDPVWDVAVNVDESGWVAEMRIPFSQIRFAEKNKHTWGIAGISLYPSQTGTDHVAVYPQRCTGFCILLRLSRRY